MYKLITRGGRPSAYSVKDIFQLEQHRLKASIYQDAETCIMIPSPLCRAVLCARSVPIRCAHLQHHRYASTANTIFAESTCKTPLSLHSRHTPAQPFPDPPSSVRSSPAHSHLDHHRQILPSAHPTLHLVVPSHQPALLQYRQRWHSGVLLDYRREDCSPRQNLNCGCENIDRHQLRCRRRTSV
jgi:hypothetical protein